MTAYFNTTELAGDRVLVEGEDIRGNKGSEVLSSVQWEATKHRSDYEDALGLVDAAIEALVAPVTAAIEAANEKLKPKALDPLFYVVEQEEVEHVPGQERVLARLGRDAVILRAIEEGKYDRLLWVNDVLEVTPAKPSVVVSAPVDDAVDPHAD